MTMDKKYIDRENYCNNICRCPGTECDKSKCPLWTAPTADVAPVVHGYWINTPPYRAVNGSYKKGQECSVCNAYYVSDGNTPYSNHPYCAECGAMMDGETRWDNTNII